MIELINDTNAQEYEAFILSEPDSLLYYSHKYRTLLERFLDAESCYFVARNSEGMIEGVLPAFLKRGDACGNILNSLPFYGSNGSILAHEGKTEIKQCLIQAFYAYAEKNDCASTTLITSPFENDKEFYTNETLFTFKDERVGQLTRLPSGSNSVPEDLMAIFHSKTRNMVRKALKSPIHIVTDGPEQYHEFLLSTHEQNMIGVGGMAKPAKFFDLIRDIFLYGKEYRIYTAIFDGKPIAALLLLYYNKTVEYFTPVIVEEYRSMQPLSLLIYQAMQEAVNDGFSWWNWGGTWLTQDGVYHFKKRWGTEDFPYYYYTRLFNDKVLCQDRTTLLSEYPYFFVVPFGELKNADT